MVLVREWSLGFGQHDPLEHLDTELALLGCHDVPANPNPVAESQRCELSKVGRNVGGGEELDPTGVVLELTKRKLALASAQHQSTGNGDLIGCFGPRLQFRVGTCECGRLMGGLVAVRNLMGLRVCSGHSGVGVSHALLLPRSSFRVVKGFA